ncbi:hypothetical protein QFC20_007311 [Naganishia adeliensis]|uniref:Uncharacterized protein n=1 Tax=Naganishia adeliensis TaxID=92952 RepID=A0ACC2UZU3_9TREE|nr:hypothetical protein QFC20_007311 [Naganishia adeliensis]
MSSSGPQQSASGVNDDDCPDTPLGDRSSGGNTRLDLVDVSGYQHRVLLARPPPVVTFAGAPLVQNSEPQHGPARPLSTLPVSNSPLMHAQGNASSESVFGPYSAIPPEVLAKRYPPVPYRPPARPVYMASPAAIAALRDLGDFDPAYADAIPINGSYEQDGRAKRTTENLVQDFSRRPPPNHVPPLVANYQLQHIARGASSSPIPSFPARLLKDYRTSIVATSEAEIKAAQKAELYSAASSSSPVPAFSLPASSPAPEPSGVTLPPSIEDSLPRGADESKEDFDKRRNRERSRKSRSIRAAALKAAVSTEAPTIASQTPTRAPLATPRESNLYWHLDFGHRGSSGPSALDIILEWMGTEGNLLTYRTSSVAARRELLEPVAESLAEQGMVACPMKMIISKVGEIYKKCCKVADEVRNQTGYGVPNDDPEGESAESMAVTVEQHLQSSQDDRIYLQLSKVLRDRHGFNPLKLQDSSMSSGTERQEIMMTLFGGGDMPKNDDNNEEDDDDLSDTEREGDEEAIQTPMGPTVAKGKATVATSGNDSLSKKRTGPAARNSSTGPAFVPSVVPAAAAESRERKTKGSSRDEIGKVVSVVIASMIYSSSMILIT